MTILVSFAVAITNILAGCTSECPAAAKETQVLLNKSLKLGDSRKTIEKFLQNAGWRISYDKYTRRYNETLHSERCGTYGAVVIYIYLDDIEGFSRAEASESYTML